MNKRLNLVVIGLILALAAFAFVPRGNDEAAIIVTGDSTGHDPGIDVLAQVKARNADNMPKPSTNFRAGHITFTDIQNYLTKTDNGFVIKLPSNTNVPTPIVHDGRLYVSGGFGSKQYFAFNAKNGEKVWAVNLDDDGPSSGVVEDDVLVFNTESCTIFACDRKTGQYLWSYWLGDPLMSMPAIANGKVFTAYPAYTAYEGNLGNQINTPPDTKAGTPKLIFSHVLAAFDLKTGKILWQKWIDGDIMSAPVADGSNLYLTTFPGTVYKVDQSTGEFLSAKMMKATSAPVVSGGDIMVTRRSDKDNNCMESIALMGEKDGQLKTQYMQKEAVYLDSKVQETSKLKSISLSEDAGNGFASGAPANSGAYLASGNIGQSNVSSLQGFQGSRVLHINGKNYNCMGDELICTEPGTGNVVWRSKVEGDLRDIGGFLATPPIKAGDNLIIATYTGEIRVINPADGKVTKRFSIGEPVRYQPIAHEGWIYVSTTSGKLVAIDTKDPKITGWSMWGGNAGHTNL
jgi:Ca-activated chloride channel homolog